MALLSLMPKFEIHKISDDEIPEIRELIEERRVNLRIAAKTKKDIKKTIEKACRVLENITY